MDNVEKTLTNIITGFIPHKEKIVRSSSKSSSSSIYYAFTIYENLGTIYTKEGLISDSYRLNSIEPCLSTMNLKNIISCIDINIDILKKDSQLVDTLSNKINELKKQIVSPPLQQNGLRIESIMIYIYYIGNLLPLFSNNKNNFEFKIQQHSTIGDKSLHFEYLMMMWFIISRMYNNTFDRKEIDDNNDNDNEEDEPIETYKRRIDSINFCIDIITEIINYISNTMMNKSIYKRFIYNESPTSISNITIRDNKKCSIEESENEQREKEEDFLIDYFGGLQGLKARLSIFYAKKYEKCFYRAIKRVNLRDILNDEEYDVYNDDNIVNIKGFSGISIQISKHYSIANTKIASSISKNSKLDVNCDHDSAIEYYTLYKSVYWQCISNFIRSIVDFHLYNVSCNNYKEDIELGKHALKRIEYTRDVINLFITENNINNTTTKKCVYHKSIISECMKLNDSIGRLYTKIYTIITTMNHRTSEGIILESIEDVINENRSSSFYKDRMDSIHKDEFDKDTSFFLKRSLHALYDIKKKYIGGNGNNNSKINDEFEIETTITPEYDIVDTLEANLQIAVLNERNRWIDYILSNMVVDNKGKNLIVIRNVDLLEKTKEEIINKMNENNDAKGFISYSNNTTMSNKLLL